MSRASRYTLIWAQPFRGEQGWKKQNFHGRTPPPPPTPHPHRCCAATHLVVTERLNSGPMMNPEDAVFLTPSTKLYMW